MGINHVQLETDWQFLIQYLSSLATPISHLGLVSSDIRFLSFQFRDISFSFVARQANIVVHRLAKFGLSLDSLCSWLEFAPDFIADILFEDSIA